MKFKVENKKTNLNSTFTFANNVLNKKSILFILSDFYDKNYFKSLNILSRKHDVIGFRIYDSFEENVKNIGFSLFYDEENNSKYWIDTSSKKVLNKIKEDYESSFKYFKKSFLKSGANYVNLETNEPYINKLLFFLKTGEKIQ